jgi:opacity protein-like surface antigen
MVDHIRRALFMRRALFVAFAVAVLTFFGTTRATAQGFVSPFIGYDFGGDSSCPEISGCSDKKLNLGVTLGAIGNVFGFEEEFGYAKDFFGEAPQFSSSVLTVMSNLMIIPNVGPVRPYVTGGLGLIKTHVDINTPSTVFSADNNNFGWDIGGGVMVLFSKHVGIRGDIRYFHSFQTFDVGPINLNLTGEKLDFGRASVAFVGRF